MAMFVNDTSKSVSVLRKGNFKMTASISKCDIMDENIKHYGNIIFPPRINFNPGTASDVLMTELSIEVVNATCPGYPDESMDESCWK